MASNYNEWYFQLYNRRTGRPMSDSTGLYAVYTVSTPTRATCYSDANGTSLTLPATMSSGVGRFFLDASVTSVDVTVLSATGQSYFLKAITLSQHRVDVDPEKTEYQFICDYNGNTACGSVADTGFDLLAGMRVHEVYVHKTTATTGATIDFGLSSDTDGFLDGVTTSVTGWELGNPVIAENTEASSIIAGTQVRGAFLVDYRTGLSGITWSVGAAGYFQRLPYNCTAATSLVYVVAATNSAGTGSGYIYVTYQLNPTQGN